jgi:hypothetical protein
MVNRLKRISRNDGFCGVEKSRAHTCRYERALVQNEKGRRERRPFFYLPVATESSREECVSDFLELIGGGLAGAAILDDLVAHFLAFAQITQAGALDRADVNENVRAAAIIGLDEAETLLAIKPFHGAGSHFNSPNIA